MEGVVFLLHPFVSVDAAVRIFLAATMAQLFLGTLALNRALFGRCDRFSLAAALFAYNGPFLFGFVNLSFGLGMALWVFALWLRWRRRRFALPLFAVLATVILICHLFAFGVYALVVGAHWLGEEAPRLATGARRPSVLARAALSRSANLLHLALPLAVYLTMMPREVRETSLVYSDWWANKLVDIVSITGFNDPIFDALCLFAACLIALSIARRLTIARAMVVPLIALFAAFLLLPHQLGEGSFVDYRMPSTATLFLVGSVAWRDPGSRRRRGAEAAALLLFAGHLGVLMAPWAAWQPLNAEYRSAFAMLPQGAKLLPLWRNPGHIRPDAHPPLDHIASLAVTERGALIPTLFADLGHQLLVYRAPYRRLHDMMPTAADAAAYDYILLLRPAELAGTTLPPFTPIAHGRTFVLGRLIHP
jgi:hypothetical protein